MNRLGSIHNSFLKKFAYRNNLLNLNRKFPRHFSSEGLPNILVTDVCAEKIKQRSKQLNKDVLLRLAVDSGGCAGYQYAFSLIDPSEVTEEDKIFEKNGAKVVVDDVSLDIVDGYLIFSDAIISFKN